MIPPLQRLLMLATPVVVGAVFQSDYYALTLLIFVLLNSLLAVGTCLCIGHAGQLSLAQAGFYAIGAYAATICTLKLGLPFGLALIAAIAVSVMAGYALGYPILRIKGHYLGLVTLAFTQIVHEVALHWTSVTGGVNGLYGIERPWLPDLGLDPLYAYALLVIAYWFAVIVLTDNLVHSRYGRAMHALKFSETSAQACGIDTTEVKTEAFAISAGIMGGAGAFYAHFIQYIGPEVFTIEQSILVIAMCILGGMADIRGVIIGTIVLTAVNEPLRSYPQLQPIVYSVLIIGVIVFMPKGILPTLRQRRRERRVAKVPAGDVV